MAVLYVKSRGSVRVTSKILLSASQEDPEPGQGIDKSPKNLTVMG